MVGGGDLHDLLMSMILHFENERGISHELQKLGRKWLRPQFEFANDLIPSTCFIS